jgi:hypothetical protein
MIFKYLPKYLICFLLLNSLFAESKRDSEIDLTPVKESIENVLGPNASIDWQRIILNSEQKSDIRSHLKVKNSIPDTLDYAKIGLHQELYYLVLDEAPGKTETFNYALYLNDDYSIKDVDVLVYRELYGGEIDDPDFRRQFFGIENPQKLIFGRSIHGVTGATISSRSITYHVRDLWIIFRMVLVAD